MSDDFSDAHLERVAIGTFKYRAGPDGIPTNPSPLDGLHYCALDLREIGGTQDGNPNRISVAAFTGDIEYLALYGAKDPTPIAKKFANSKWKL